LKVQSNKGRAKTTIKIRQTWRREQAVALDVHGTTGAILSHGGSGDV
jgi:hypothetical protein